MNASNSNETFETLYLNETSQDETPINTTCIPYMMDLNETSQNDTLVNITFLPYTGSGQQSLVPVDALYYSIHGVALASLTISIISSVVVIIWQQKAASSSFFFKRKLGERLVIYLAVTDLLYSFGHLSDHLLNLIGLGVPARIPCIVFASITMECIFAQSIIVLLTAASLCLLVSFNKKICYGPYDVILLLVSHGVPLVVVIYSLCLDYVGNHGYWCFINVANPKAIGVVDIMANSQFAVALIIIGIYVCVWITIALSVRRLKKFRRKSDSPPCSDTASFSRESMETSSHVSNRHQRTYVKTSKVLTLFVVAYIAQWWPSITFYGLRMFITIHPYFYLPIVLFFNIGGLFNMFAYTFVRRYTFSR